MRGVWVEVARNGTVGSNAQHVVTGIDIMGGDSVVTSRTGVGVAETWIGCCVVDGAPFHRSNRVVRVGVTGGALLYVMETGQQTGLRVALRCCTTWVFCYVVGMQNVMDGWL